jgi:hypothetical protein
MNDRRGIGGAWRERGEQDADRHARACAALHINPC